MVDNTTLPGTGDVYAAEDRAGIKYQKVLTEPNLSGHSAGIDAFGKTRVSTPHSIFSSKLLHADNQALLWAEDLLSGSMATSGPTEPKPFIDFTSTDVTAGQRCRQTFRRFNYQPGKSQQILMTGILELASGTKTGCKRRIGLFDDNNGLFFESDAGTVNVVLRTNDTGTPVDVQFAQASWNLDNMDGDGDTANPSGETLDIEKAQIFVMDFQWLSVGRVRFGLEHDGHVHYVHEYNVANIGVIPWASTPNLPLRYEIITTSSSGVCSMRCICAAVISEGGTEEIGITRYKSTAGAAVTCATDNIVYAIVGIKLKSTHIGHTVKMLKAGLQIQTTSDSGEWILLFNPTIAGTFTYSNLANSAVMTAIGAAANTVTSGTEIDGGFLEATSGGGGSGSDSSILDSALLLGADIANVVDEVALCFRPNAGTINIEVEGSLTWKEIA